MSKDVTIRARTNTRLKSKVDKIFEKLGLTPSQAVNLFYSQVLLQNGLPFEVKIPNKATLKAMKEANNKIGKSFSKVDDLFKDLGK